jgi:uncharacterized protein with PIN domain
MIYFWIIIAAAVLLSVVVWLNLTRCPNCKKRTNIYKINSEKIDEEKFAVRKKEYIQHYSRDQTHYNPFTGGTRPNVGELKPASTEVREIRVPMLRTFYTVTYECKNCGHKFQKKEHMEKEIY